MKKIFSIFVFFIVILSSFSLSAFAYGETRIDDAADLFSDSEETAISEALIEFTFETSYSAVVLTTDYADGKSSQEYADDYFDNLILSEGWEEKGILFLIDMDNREVCISTMGECIDVYAGSIDYIIDSGYDDLADGNYSECIILMIDAAAKCAQNIPDDDYYGGYYADDYYGDYPIYDGGGNYDNYYQPSNDSFSFSNMLICIVISVIIAAVTVFAVKSSYKNMGKGDEFDADDVILNLTGSNDTVISRNVITTRVPKNNNHHKPGGGSSGGGVTHRSSGGFSHGGGSRKF